MNKKLENKENTELFETILKLQTVEECYMFFEDLCTTSEIEEMSQRLQVAKMLRDKKQYNEIVSATGASTATISRVKRSLNYGADGYSLMLDRMEK